MLATIWAPGTKAGSIVYNGCRKQSRCGAGGLQYAESLATVATYIF
jgi:hypothetical protein